MPSLQELSISDNTIGIESAKSLASYLARPDCPLQRLFLGRSEVTDKECEQFVNSMKNRKI